MNNFEVKICDNCDKPMKLIKTTDCGNHYQHVFGCPSCVEKGLFSTKTVIEAKGDGLTFEEMEAIANDVNDFYDNMEKKLNAEPIPKRKFRELNCFTSKGFEKGIDEIGMFFITEEAGKISFSIGIEGQFEKFMNKNRNLVREFLDSNNIIQNFKECIDKDILKYRGLDGLVFVRFGIRNDNGNLVVDINKSMVDKENPDLVLQRVTQIIKPIVEILLGLEYEN